jgi:hypothetical protein
MMNKITFACLCFLLSSTILAQEPAAPAVTSPDTTTQIPAAQAPAQPVPENQVNLPLEPLPTEPSVTDTVAPVIPEPTPQEQTSAPRPPVAPGLIPPQPVLPLIAPKTAQMKPSETTNYAQMIYWKSLTKDEKKVFLDAYLFRTYETLEQVKRLPEMKSAIKSFQKKIADPVFDLFRPLNEKQKDDLVFWIDIFYRNDLNKDKNFYEALRYAGEKMKVGHRSMHEIYQEHNE